MSVAGLSRQASCGPVESVIVLGAAFLLLPFVGAKLQQSLGVWGVAATEMVCVLLPALVAVAWSRVSPKAALGLGLPPARVMLGAALAGAGAFYLVAGGVESLQERVAPMSNELRDQLRRFIVPAEGPRPLAVDLAVLALLPALCEEALFRGVLLRALAGVSGSAAVLITSLAFGAFHYSLYKFAPTALLGLVLGALALRSGSLWTSVIAHALNNSVVVVLVRSGHDDPPAPGGALAALPLLGAALALGLGLRLASSPNLQSEE